MSGGVLLIRNRQRERRVNTAHLRRIVTHLVQSDLAQKEFEIGVQLIGERAMVQANEGFLKHGGCTDVITFDYAARDSTATLHGDLLVCVAEATRQAKRFRTTWPHEVVRYIVHGLLHLSGYDDVRAKDRKKMKMEENRLLRRLARGFDVQRIDAAQGTTHSRLSRALP